MSAGSLQKKSSNFWNSPSPIASYVSIRNSINNYRVQPWVHFSPLSLQISTWNTLNPKPFLHLQHLWFKHVDDVHSARRNDQVNKCQEHLNSIDPHIKFTIDLPIIDVLPFLDTLTKPTSNFIESIVYRNPPTQIGT